MDEEKLTEFWLENYLAPDTLCALCGNKGVIVTVDRGAHWCVCPNGRSMAKGRLTSRAADLPKLSGPKYEPCPECGTPLKVVFDPSASR